MKLRTFRQFAPLRQRKKVPVVLDGTLTTPFLFNSRQAGVAIEVLSSTKYISGGATTVGGLIIDNGVFDWAQNPSLKDASKKAGPGAFMMQLRREVYRNTGASMSPHNAGFRRWDLKPCLAHSTELQKRAFNRAFSRGTKENSTKPSNT